MEAKINIVNKILHAIHYAREKLILNQVRTNVCEPARACVCVTAAKIAGVN